MLVFTCRTWSTLIIICGGSGGTITSLDIAYTGEQWRNGNTAAARDDRLDFQYSTDATSLTTGAWTEALPVEGDLLAAVDRQARDADLVVLGVSDKWVEDKHSLGSLRDAVLARAAAPLLVVRRHGQRPRRLRGQREWMEEHDSGQVPAVSVEGQAGVSIRSGR